MPYAVPGCAVMRIKITIKTSAKAYAASASSYIFQKCAGVLLVLAHYCLCNPSNAWGLGTTQALKGFGLHAMSHRASIYFLVLNEWIFKSVIH